MSTVGCCRSRIPAGQYLTILLIVFAHTSLWEKDTWPFANSCGMGCQEIFSCVGPGLCSNIRQSPKFLLISLFLCIFPGDILDDYAVDQY